MLEINNLSSKRINKTKLKKIANTFFKKYRFPSDAVVSLAIISDSKMRQINSVYRGINKTTDVLAFTDLNEVLVNINQIMRQAKKSGRKINDEFNFIFVHGLLHLIGMTDDTEKGRLEMIKAGEDFLKNLR